MFVRCAVERSRDVTRLRDVMARLLAARAFAYSPTRRSPEGLVSLRRGMPVFAASLLAGSPNSHV